MSRPVIRLSRPDTCIGRVFRTSPHMGACHLPRQNHEEELSSAGWWDYDEMRGWYGVGGEANSLSCISLAE